ncbi:MAG: HD domain-containing protein [Candidatus Aminicenantes bacterium]|nr:MAG: HD domain-containing protein [Candidatus Aminicenantes bacterium]
MTGQQKIFLLGENIKQRVNLKRFLLGQALNISDAKTVSETENRLLKAHEFSVAVFSFFPLDTPKINLLRKIRAANPRLGIILLLSRENPKLAIALLQQGIVDQISSQDNLPSVFSAIINEFRKKEIISTNAAYSKRLSSLKSEQEKNLKRAMDLEEIYDSTLENLMTALDLRDVETFGHSRTVAKYSQILARILDIKDKTTLDNIRKGALLHDVGKIAIPDSILKKPSPLDQNEWEKIKLHPTLGYGLVKEIKLLEEVGNIILCHHERYDGSGYPSGLKKDEIPLEARIFALADALDAITSFRPYRERRDFQVAKNEIEENRGQQFDPQVVDAFGTLSIETWEKIRFETTHLIPSFEAFRKLS